MGKNNKKGRKKIRLTPEMSEAMNDQLQRFTEKFGRPPGPNDPIFFDPSADEPRPIIEEIYEHHLLEAMHKAKVRPALIYAFQKTGRIVTEANRKNLTKAELKEWTDAMKEWHANHPEE